MVDRKELRWFGTYFGWITTGSLGTYGKEELMGCREEEGKG
jgi:hypothetical protein